MKLSDLPIKINIPWAQNAGSAYVQEVPDASQIGVTAGAASWNDGFVPLNLTAKASGGVPPSGQQTNGALRRISAWVRYIMAAGVVPYDATWQAANGGYPLNALVSTGFTGAAGTSGTLGRVWASIVDGNLTNPDTGGAGWVYLCLPSDVLALLAANPTRRNSATFSTVGSGSWAVPAGVTAVFAQVWAPGGGGGGSGSSSQAGGGGGAGGYVEAWVYITSGTASLPYVIGAAGAGGNGNTPTNATAGATTSFASGILYATGGGAGGTNNGAQGIGGLGYGTNGSTGTGVSNVTGVFTVGGGNGGNGGYLTSDNTTTYGGFGAPSYLSSLIPNTFGGSINGFGPGTGGTGGSRGQGSYLGGNGGPALIRLSW